MEGKAHRLKVGSMHTRRPVTNQGHRTADCVISSRSHVPMTPPFLTLVKVFPQTPDSYIHMNSYEYSYIHIFGYSVTISTWKCNRHLKYENSRALRTSLLTPITTLQHAPPKTFLASVNKWELHPLQSLGGIFEFLLWLTAHIQSMSIVFKILSRILSLLNISDTIPLKQAAISSCLDYSAVF